ncbi:MAG: hypothetical protein K2N89_04070 [Lachnospiraceae bacterium]|nr:hypothetical protein [Lachnospiraceae bacterium]
MDRENKLHIRDLISGPSCDAAGSDSVYFFIADEISDTGFIMKTALDLMNKGCNAFCFSGKYKDIWHKTVEDVFNQSNAECENLRSCDSIDDAAKEAAGFLNIGRDVYLLCDSRSLCSAVVDKIREREMYVSFHIGSLINSME